MEVMGKEGGRSRANSGRGLIKGAAGRTRGGGGLCLARGGKETSRRGEVGVVGERKRKTRREGKPDSSLINPVQISD